MERRLFDVYEFMEGDGCGSRLVGWYGMHCAGPAVEDCDFPAAVFCVPRCATCGIYRFNNCTFCGILFIAPPELLYMLNKCTLYNTYIAYCLLCALDPTRSSSTCLSVCVFAALCTCHKDLVFLVI